MPKVNLSVSLLVALALVGSAEATPLPLAWTCAGTCGSSGADGVVTLAPTGNSLYQYVSTSNGLLGVGILPSGALGTETHGSTLSTSVFSATAGTSLKFYFNYSTSDGGGYADYAYAELYSSTNAPVSLLFTARTVTSGTIVPGTDMPAPSATLDPVSVPIIAGGPVWSPLDEFSGSCYSSGCGYTGWIQSSYTILAPGDYYLKVGVVNWLDTAYDSGLAIDGVTVNDVSITPASNIPEPSTMFLLGTGLLVFVVATKAKLKV